MGFWRVDRVWFGEHLQSGGEVRSLADDRLLLRGALADQIADHYQAGSDPDARMELVGFDGRKCVSVGNRALSQVEVDGMLDSGHRRHEAVAAGSDRLDAARACPLLVEPLHTPQKFDDRSVH